MNNIKPFPAPSIDPPLYKPERLQQIQPHIPGTGTLSHTSSVLKRVLITQGCLSCCWAVLKSESRHFLLLTSHQWAGWRCTRSQEGTQLVQVTPHTQRNILYHMASCSAYRASGRSKQGNIQSDGVCVPKSLLRVIELGFLGVVWTPPYPWAMVNDLLCLCARLLLYLWNSFFSTYKFSHIYSSNSLPQPTGGKWVSSCV